jgi:glutamate--cysteine ligase catalytic subunit
MRSDDGEIPFLRKVSTRAELSTSETLSLGSSTPLFRGSNSDGVKLAALLGEGTPFRAEAPDTATAVLDGESSSKEETQENVRAAIHMDAMAFGMGCCCLQITFQAKDLDESRYIYDQLAILAPIMMALTASTPLLRGRIADTDCRWGIISESVDCRTLAERGRSDPDAPQADFAGKGERRIYKSRYDSISTYIYQDTSKLADDGSSNRVLNMYNDIPVPIDEDSFKALRKAGIDPALSQHIAHLFIRDPLVVFEGAVEEVDDDQQTEHFESIQSTNW